jgi:uncharacterized membrane protein YgcG
MDVSMPGKVRSLIMTGLLRAIEALFLLLLVSLSGAISVAAQGAGRSVAWQRFDVDLAVQRDGSVKVSETQTIQFNGAYQQGYRLVPMDSTTGVTDVNVEELVDGRSIPYSRGAGQPNTFAASASNDGLAIDWWFPATANATRTFVVQYTVSGAVRIYDAGDQLQWRAIYADRDGAVGASTVTVHLPADAPPTSVQSAWYRYPASGSVGALRPVGQGSQIDGRSVQFTLGPLAPQQGAEIRVQFPHGLVSAAPPAWQADADRADWLVQTVAPIGDFVALLLTLGILGGGGAVLLLLWFSSGRDPGIGSVPPRLQEPPSSLPAPLAGTLVDEIASERETVAALVDLADRGIVQLKDERNPQLVDSQSDVRVTLAASLDDPRLRSYERVLLEALFGPRPSVPAEALLSNVKPQFQAAIPLIAARLYESVTQEGLFPRNPESTRRRWRAVGVIVLVAGIILAVAAGALLAGAMHIPWLPGLALAIVGGGLTWLAGGMPRRTPRGALEAAKWRAFGAYLGEAARAAPPGPALPLTYLPYAVAFGVDQSFVRHLESVGTPPPRWFDQGGWFRGPGGVVILPGGWYGGSATSRGPGGLPRGAPGGGAIGAPSMPNPQGWSDVLAGLLNAASEAMAHGGGSGGWSGGGFGGGGGGGGGSGGFR